MSRRIVLCVLTAMAISGCCTVQVYKGGKRAYSQIARIKKVLRVEFKDVGPGCTAEIMPGLTKAVVGDYDKSELIPFIAEPGHTYIGKFKWADSERPFKQRWYFWIEDKSNGRVVGGKKPI